MPRSGIEVNSKRFEAALKAEMRQLERQLGDDLGDFGREAAEEVRSRAPVGATGKLRRSVGHEPGKDRQGPYVTIDVGRFYASFVEFGTRHMRARPFIRPGLEAARRRFSKIVGR